MRSCTPSRAVRISTGILRPSPRQLAQPAHAVAAGQAEVEHHRVVGHVDQRRVRPRAVAEPVDHMLALAQPGGQRLAEQRIVLDDEHAHQDSAAICRKACSKTSGGWPPAIRCRSLMITAGTEWMPASR